MSNSRYQLVDSIAAQGVKATMIEKVVANDSSDENEKLKYSRVSYERTKENQVEEDTDDNADTPGTVTSRKKKPIKYIQNRTRRHVTFAKRRHGIMKKAYELSVLTGANILLLIESHNTGLVYTFTTPRLEPVVTGEEGKSLVRRCLNG